MLKGKPVRRQKTVQYMMQFPPIALGVFSKVDTIKND